jgi:hypothetical protein
MCANYIGKHNAILDISACVGKYDSTSIEFLTYGYKCYNKHIYGGADNKRAESAAVIW